MKVALVHDYIREFGGAERVLKSLSEIYPDAPIYTAFRVSGSTADREFSGKVIRESFLAPILKIWKLYSPLRFLVPVIWGSVDLSGYDLVITSCSWYITRGFKVGPKTKVVAYCHTPPRWLYGYETSVGFTKYWPVKIYAAVVGYFMRKYDYESAQKVDYWIANSKNVQGRIKKFYGKDSVVIYPPVEVTKIRKASLKMKSKDQQSDYFLIASRLVGAKGIESVIKAFSTHELSRYKLKVAGEPFGLSNTLSALGYANNIEFLGRPTDSELYNLYAGARAFICLAKDEDFGITPVEAMAAGTPVIAYNGGGYKESVIDGKTGILINSTDTKAVVDAITHIIKLPQRDEIKKRCMNQAKKFSKEIFKNRLRKYISNIF